MPLSPEIDIPETETNRTVSPSKTYKLDFENRRVYSEKIDGKEAIEQFIHKALRTRRLAHPIYSSGYGSELYDLIRDNTVTIEYKKSEIQRLITETIIYDDRIEQVSDFNIQIDEENVYINFKVETVEGVIDIEEVIPSV